MLKVIFCNTEVNIKIFITDIRYFQFPLHKCCRQHDVIRLHGVLKLFFGDETLFFQMSSAEVKGERHSTDNSLMVIDTQFTNCKPPPPYNCMIC